MFSGSGKESRKNWKVTTFLNNNGLVNGEIPKGRPCPFENQCSAFVESKCPSTKFLKNAAYSCAFARGLSLDAEETKREIAEREERERREFWLSNIDGLLKVVKHNRTSCSDADPCNWSGSCIRCTLLRFQRENYWPEEFVLEVNLWEKKVSERDVF